MLVEGAGSIPLISVPVKLQVWAFSGLQKAVDSFGSAWGFHHSLLLQRFYNTSTLPSILNAYNKALCDTHTAPQWLAYTDPTETAADFNWLTSQCGLRLFNAAYLSSSADSSPAYVSMRLKELEPRILALQRANLLNRAYVYAFDESHVDHLAAIRALFGAIKSRWPELRTLAVLNWAIPVDLPVDIWVMQYEFAERDDVRKSMQARRAAGIGEIWGYHCVSPAGDYLNSFVDRSPMHPRLLLGWLTHAVGFTGWLYWYVDWSMFDFVNAAANVIRLDESSTTPYNVSTYNSAYGGNVNGDGNLIYPGKEGMLPSIRLENVRNGLEDYALLSLAIKSAGASAVNALVSRLVRSGANFSDDPGVLETVRREAAKLIATAPSIV